MTRAQAQRIAKEKQRLQLSEERKAVSVAGSAIKRQVNEFLSFLREVKSIPAAIEGVNLMVPSVPIQIMLQRIYQSTGLISAKQQRSFLTGQKSDLDIEIDQYLRTYVNSALVSRVYDITDTTKKEIFKWLTYAEINGLNWEEAGKLISKEVGLNKNRAILIARTESVNAANYGALLAVKQTGLNTVKKWVPFLDSRTRPDHAEMVNSEWIPTEQAFLVGGMEMQHPGDPAGGAAQVCRCRCTAIYEIVRNERGLPAETSEIDSDIAAIFDSLFVPA